MVKQNIAVGTAENDGTGDSARAGGIKINANFTEIYDKINSRWVDAKNYGLSTSASASANKTALIAAFAAAISSNTECYIPAGVYNVDPGLSWNNSIVRLSGAGSQSTVLRFSSNTTTGLKIGIGTYVSDLGAQGWVRDFKIDCALLAPATPGSGVAGLLIDSVKFAEVSNLYIMGFDVGLDMINNNYGTLFRNIHSRYGQCNLSLRIRNSVQSGNDFVFENCWWGGKHRTISIEPDNISGADGFHFIGGQISGGQGLSVSDTDKGCVVFSKDWQTGAVAGEGSRVIFNGTTFEGFKRMWAVRLFSPAASIVFRDVKITSTSAYNDADAPLGFMRHSLPYHDHFQFLDMAFAGGFSTSLFSIVPNSGAWPTYIEIGSHGFINVAGVDINLFARGVFDLIGLNKGISLAGGTKSIIMLDGLRLRNNSGILEKSTDGTVWSAV